MRWKSIVAVLGSALVLAGPAYGGPLTTVTVDPQSLLPGQASTTVDGVICPTVLPCDSNSFQNPGGTPGSLYFAVNVENDGELHVLIDLEPPNAGTLTLLDFQIYDAVGGNILASGARNSPAHVDVLGGQQYFVFVQYGFMGRDNQRALWSVQLDGESDLNERERQIPEPGTLALMGLALTGLWAARRRR